MPEGYFLLPYNQIPKNIPSYFGPKDDIDDFEKGLTAEDKGDFENLLPKELVFLKTWHLIMPCFICLVQNGRRWEYKKN